MAHGATKYIKIRQDNAKPHISDDDPDFRQAANQNGFSMSLVQQPPNSPNTNVNDLGWFRAIQSLQHQTACNNLDELVQTVEKSFNDLAPQTLDNVFLSLQGYMVEIMKVQGQNKYKIPHMGKVSLRRHAQLPTNLEVPLDLAIEAIEYLKTMGCTEGLHIISQALGIQQIGGTGVIAGAEVFEGAKVIEVAENIAWAEVLAGAEHIEGAKVIAEAEHIEGAKEIEWAEDVEGAENIERAEHIVGTKVIAGAEHIEGAKVIAGAKHIEGAKEV